MKCAEKMSVKQSTERKEKPKIETKTVYFRFWGYNYSRLSDRGLRDHFAGVGYRYFCIAAFKAVSVSFNIVMFAKLAISQSSRRIRISDQV